jgi:transcriptional regulator with XRE-family HTH domain
MEHKIHEGRNVKRFREMLGMKQEALAAELGEEWTQKKVSLLETKESLDAVLLERISTALKIPVEAFRTFDEEQALSVISNTFNDSFNDSTNAFSYNKNCTFNPLDKLMELMDANKELYERLLASEREKNALLERMLREV